MFDKNGKNILWKDSILFLNYIIILNRLHTFWNRFCFLLFLNEINILPKIFFSTNSKILRPFESLSMGWPTSSWNAQSYRRFWQSPVWLCIVSLKANSFCLSLNMWTGKFQRSISHYQTGIGRIWSTRNQVFWRCSWWTVQNLLEGLEICEHFVLTL